MHCTVGKKGVNNCPCSVVGREMLCMCVCVCMCLCMWVYRRLDCFFRKSPGSIYTYPRTHITSDSHSPLCLQNHRLRRKRIKIPLNIRFDINYSPPPSDTHIFLSPPLCRFLCLSLSQCAHPPPLTQHHSSLLSFFVPLVRSIHPRWGSRAFELDRHAILFLSI